MAFVAFNSFQRMSGLRKKAALVPVVLGYRYYKFEIVNNGGDSYTGFDELLIGYNSVKLDYTGATATDINNNGYTAEGPSRAIDGGAQKWIVGFSATNHPALIVDFKSSKLANCYTYITGNDLPLRDPLSFIFYGSNDSTTWVTLNTQPSFVSTTTRDYQLPWIAF
jgi:hypothetical protein